MSSPESLVTPRTTADPSSTASLPLVIPPDHISLRVLRAHVQQWDWMARSRDSLRVASGHMSLFDFALAQRLRNARHRLIDRVDRGEQVTEDDLIEVMGADFTFGGEKVAIVTNADRDLRNVQYRSGHQTRGQRLGEDPRRRVGEPPSRAEWPSESSGSAAAGDAGRNLAGPGTDAVLGDASAVSGSIASVTDWLNDDPDALLGSLGDTAALAHAEACSDVLYEATVCAWARTMIASGIVVEMQLPAAVRRWLADDGLLRLAGDNQRLRDTYFTDPSRESEALRRAIWIDALSRTDPRASAVALPSVPGEVTAATMGGTLQAPNSLRRNDVDEPISSVRESLRSLSPAVPQTVSLPTSRTVSSKPDPVPQGTGNPEARNTRHINTSTDKGRGNAGTTRRASVKGENETDSEGVPHTAPQSPPVQPRPRARKSPAASQPVAPVPELLTGDGDFSGLPKGEDGAPGPGVWVRGQRINGVFVEMRDEQVAVLIGEETRTVQGPLHRTHGPAVIEPDGTSRYYVDGVLSREDGPAIEAADPAHDVYAINGVIKSLDLPPALLRDRLFRAQMFRAWERAGFPINAEFQARAVLATMAPVDREAVLQSVRHSTDQRDQQFVASADALYGRCGPPLASTDPSISTDSSTVDDYDPCIDMLLSCGDHGVDPAN